MDSDGPNRCEAQREGNPISAYAELQQWGCLHRRGVALVSRIVREELKRFIALEQLDPEDLTHDFFVVKITALTAMLLAQATSDESFGKLVRRTVRNWMIDRARATGTGPLRRSIEKVLAETPLFECVPAGQEGAGRWRLAHTHGPPWGGDPDSLVVVAWAVPDVRVPIWSQATRRAPIADRPSMVAILKAVLQAATGSLETAQLVHVFAQRFAAAMDPIEVPLPEHQDDDDEDGGGSDVPSDAPGPEDLVIAKSMAAEAGAAANEIVERLSDDERAVVSVIDDPAAVMQRLGRARSQSAEFTRRLKAKICELAGTGADRDEIVRAVIAICGGPQNGQIG
jgi:hypothetical protein